VEALRAAYGDSVRDPWELQAAPPARAAHDGRDSRRGRAPPQG
jgi:hypothetical protein